MARDKKLREVLDSLSGDPARTLPTPDRELMESVLRRLKIQENRRLAPHEAPPELDAAAQEARMNEEEMRALREKQEHDSEEMQRLQEERERLLEHQRELEERLARLEAASHGGPLSYVDEPETVEFSRVDLEPPEEELLEFEYLGQGEREGPLQEPQADAWEEEPTPESQTDWGDWPQSDEGAVSWDDDEAEVAWQSEQEPTPAPSWKEPGESAWDPEEPEPAQDEAPPWSQPATEDALAQEKEHAPPSPSPTEDPLENLDDRTRAELEELESQLAELEREIERRGEKDASDPDEENA